MQAWPEGASIPRAAATPIASCPCGVWSPLGPLEGLPPICRRSCCLNEGTCSKGPLPACRNFQRHRCNCPHRDRVPVYACMLPLLSGACRRPTRHVSWAAAPHSSSNFFLLTFSICTSAHGARLSIGTGSANARATHPHSCRSRTHRRPHRCHAAAVWCGCCCSNRPLLAAVRAIPEHVLHAAAGLEQLAHALPLQQRGGGQGWQAGGYAGG